MCAEGRRRSRARLSATSRAPLSLRSRRCDRARCSATTRRTRTTAAELARAIVAPTSARDRAVAQLEFETRKDVKPRLRHARARDLGGFVACVRGRARAASSRARAVARDMGRRRPSARRPPSPPSLLRPPLPRPQDGRYLARDDALAARAFGPLVDGYTHELPPAPLPAVGVSRNLRLARRYERPGALPPSRSTAARCCRALVGLSRASILLLVYNIVIARLFATLRGALTRRRRGRARHPGRLDPYLRSWASRTRAAGDGGLAGAATTSTRRRAARRAASPRRRRGRRSSRVASCGARSASWSAFISRSSCARRYSTHVDRRVAQAALRHHGALPLMLITMFLIVTAPRATRSESQGKAARARFDVATEGIARAGCAPRPARAIRAAAFNEAQHHLRRGTTCCSARELRHAPPSALLPALRARYEATARAAFIMGGPSSGSVSSSSVVLLPPPTTCATSSGTLVAARP